MPLFPVYLRIRWLMPFIFLYGCPCFLVRFVSWGGRGLLEGSAAKVVDADVAILMKPNCGLCCGDFKVFHGVLCTGKTSMYWSCMYQDGNQFSFKVKSS